MGRTGLALVAASVVAGTVALGQTAHGSTGQAVEPIFAETGAGTFGTFAGIRYVGHIGYFEGRTANGRFRVPYEIVAPEDSTLGNGTVLVEPPHFLFGPVGRESVLRRSLLFARGFAYATVGVGTNGLNILRPGGGLVLADRPVLNPGVPDPFGIVDEEILIQFTTALMSDPYATSVLGPLERRYAYGVSQTAAVLLETLHASAGVELFDLTLLHSALWKPWFEPPTVFEHLPDRFRPLPDVGRVVFVEAEGDQLLSAARQFRSAAADPDYRVYEVAGAAHLPDPAANPLDHGLVARAAFVAADRWVRGEATPPPSTLIADDASGALDPVYADFGLVTGIQRDADLNAVGGVRLPDLAAGRARFVASNFSLAVFGVPGIVGATVDLACAPRDASAPRFRTHGEYVRRFASEVRELRAAGLLLEDDAEMLFDAAAESGVGKPGTCP